MKPTIEEIIAKINNRDADKGLPGSSYTFARACKTEKRAEDQTEDMNDDMMQETEDVTGSNDEKQYLEMTISSEAYIEDWFGFLKLEHSEQAIVPDRFNNGASFRDGHWGPQVGIINNWSITPSRKLKVGVNFSPHNPQAVICYREYRDRFRKNTSIRFVVYELVMEREVEGVGYYCATKWEPIHGAAVEDGADSSVGMDRSLTIVKNIELTNKQENRTMETKDLTPEQVETIKANLKKELQADNKAAVDRAFEQGGKEALDNIAGILNVVRAFKDKFKDTKEFDIQAEAETYIKGGMSQRQFSDLVASKNVAKQPVDTFDLSKKDRERFSTSRLLLSFDPKNKVDAGFEMEVCEAYKKERGIDKANGVVIPRNVIGNRTMTVASATGGGNLVGSNLQANQFVPPAYNKALVDALGVVRLPGLVGDIQIPTQTSSIVGGWMTDESTGANASDAAVGQKTMSPKTFHATTSYSRKLLLQSTPQVDMVVENDILRQANLGVDKAFFHGTNSNGQPCGIVPTSGLALLETKTSFDFADMVAMESAVADNNLDINSMAYVTTPALRGTLKTTLQDAGVPGYIWSNNEVNGYRGFASKQITTGFIFHGDFSQGYLGEWGGYDIVVDPFTSKVGLIYVTIYVSVDVALRYAGAFAVYKPS